MLGELFNQLKEDRCGVAASLIFSLAVIGAAYLTELVFPGAGAWEVVTGIFDQQWWIAALSLFLFVGISLSLSIIALLLYAGSKSKANNKSESKS